MNDSHLPEMASALSLPDFTRPSISGLLPKVPAMTTAFPVGAPLVDRAGLMPVTRSISACKSARGAQHPRAVRCIQKNRRGLFVPHQGKIFRPGIFRDDLGLKSEAGCGVDRNNGGCRSQGQNSNTARQFRRGMVQCSHFYRICHGSGGPVRIRKKFAGGLLVMLVVQENGMGGAFVVKTTLQSVKFVEDWI